MGDVPRSCFRFQYLADPSAKLRHGSRPWIKRSDTVVNLPGGHAPIEESVFLLQDRRERRRCRVFWGFGLKVPSTMPCIGSESAKGLPSPRADRTAALDGLFGSDFGLFAEIHGTGIQSFVQQHRANAGFRFAVCDRPMNRRGAAILRKKRTVQIDAAVSRKLQQPRGRIFP